MHIIFHLEVDLDIEGGATSTRKHLPFPFPKDKRPASLTSSILRPGLGARAWLESVILEGITRNKTLGGAGWWLASIQGKCLVLVYKIQKAKRG